MIYANSKENKKIKATRTTIGYCPGCNEQLIPKCGVINIWHWSHKSKCDFDYKPETQWHLNWKQFAEDNKKEIEKIFSSHVADIYNSNLKTIIELQYSKINTLDIISRSEYYKKLGYNVDWIFNLDYKIKNKTLRLLEKKEYVTVKQKWRKKQLNFLFGSNFYPLYGNVYIDIDEIKNNFLFKINKLYSNGNGYGIVVPKDAVFGTYKCLFIDCKYVTSDEQRWLNHLKYQHQI